jgi:hypothetical protein
MRMRMRAATERIESGIVLSRSIIGGELVD